MLIIENLRTGYGPLEVIKGISIKVEKGEIVTLLGANGAGKSTTLMTICGVNKIRSGKILFEDHDLSKLAPHEIVKLGIVQVPEGRRIFPKLTVRENLDMGAYITGHGGNSKVWDHVFSLFPILKEREKQLGGTLSGGEQQMLAIGRALMSQPKLLLLDEPSLGLAPLIVKKIFEIIKSINTEGTTVLLVEQNAQMALNTAHRGYVLQTGCVACTDTGANLLKSPEVRKAYLGES